MTYEEKLDRIVKVLKEAKKLARKDYNSKLYIDNENIKGMNLNELRDILLQLQDDEQIIKLNGIPTKLKSTFDQTDDILKGHKDYFLIDILDAFDGWYSKFLIKQKSRLENLSGANLTNITHIVKLIEERLELDQSEKITIGFVSSIHELEGYEREDIVDLVGTYAQGLRYLKNIGVIEDFTTEDLSLSSEITLNISNFFEILEKIKELEQKKSMPQAQIPTKIDKTIESKAVWPEEFKWEAQDFVFGQYGSIGFTSEDRRFIFKILTDKKGNWATINELKGNKDAGYVRSTIKQIEDRLPKKAKGHITIVSTQDDDAEEKPNTGAYRIKVLP